jgi:hypothetical protein
MPYPNDCREQITSHASVSHNEDSKEENMFLLRTNVILKTQSFVLMSMPFQKVFLLL